MHKFFAAALALAAATFAGEANAQQAAWRLTEAHGVVRVTQPGQAPSDAQANTALVAGATVTTGAESGATLANGPQRIVMTPNSRMSIAADSSDAMTRIIQDLGSLLFQVDRRGSQHFRVETPLLAAIVKGTTFTVTAGGAQDTVHVSQGLVEVRAGRNGASQDVPAGATARVARDAPSEISMAAPAEQASTDQGVALAAVDYETASGGVVTNPVAVERNHGSRGAAMSNSDNRNGANAAGNAGPGHGLIGQSWGAIRSVVAMLTNNGNHNGNGNSNGGGYSGNGNSGGGNSGGGNSGGGNSGNGNSGNGNSGGGNSGGGNSGGGNSGNGGGNGGGNGRGGG